jgi:hypothetical protein
VWAVLAAAGDSGAGDALLYGIPVTTFVAGVGWLAKAVLGMLKEERAEVARLNAAAIERAERLTPLVIELTRLVPELLAHTPTPAQIDRLTAAMRAQPPQTARKRPPATRR